MTNLENELREDPKEKRYVLHRRFDRIGRLFGDAKMEKLYRSHVMVVGIGGVGSWAAESLARSGVGTITLVDYDDICITNTNRQLHAMAGFIGKIKTEVMAERIKKINPQVQVISVPEFYTKDNSEQVLGRNPDLIIDAIDNLTSKCHLLDSCRKKGIPILTSGGSGSRLDPLQIKVADLSDSYADPLLAQVRRMLRQQYGWDKGPFGITTAFSTEKPSLPQDLSYDKGEGFKCVCPQGINGLTDCDKKNVIHGTASFVTGTFGFVLVAEAIKKLLNTPEK